MNKLIAVVLMLLVLPFTAHAYLIDTGTPDEFGSAFIVSNPNGFSGQQSLASQFVLTQDSLVTSLEGYFYDAPFFATPGTVTVALYSGSLFDNVNGGPIPDVNTQIFSQKLEIDEVEHNDFLLGSWHGIQGLNQSLAGGTYWIAFEGRADDTYDGAMPGSSPNPLLTSAFDNGGGYAYSQFLTDNGVRIDGAPVPEPASMVLLSSGLLGMLLRKKIRVS